MQKSLDPPADIADNYLIETTTTQETRNMKIMTLNGFKALVARSDWTRTQDVEVVSTMARSIEQWNEEADSLELVDVPHTQGYAVRESAMGDFKIRYTEGFDYDDNDAASTFSAGTDGQDDVWEVEGLVVVDDDGDEIDAHCLADYVGPEFSEIDYSGFCA